MATSAWPGEPLRPADDFPPYSGTPTRVRPTGLNVIVVLALVLGVLGLGTSLLGLATLAAQPWIQNVQREAAAAGDLQANMQKNAETLTARYWTASVALGVMNLALSAGLLLGAIMALAWKPKARMLLVVLFSAAIPFAVVQAAVQVSMQLDNAAMMADAMSHPPKIAGSGPNAAAAQGAAIGAAMARVVALLSIGFFAAWALGKMVLFAVGIRYLRRPNIRRLFDDAAAAE